MHFSLCGLFVTCWKRKEKVVGIRENEQLFDRFVYVRVNPVHGGVQIR